MNFSPIEIENYCKKNSHQDSALLKEVATFTSLLANKKKLSHGYICSTAIKTSANYNKLNINNVSNVLYDSWSILDKDFFISQKLLVNFLLLYILTI